MFQGNRSNPAFIWDVSSFHAQALKLNLDLQLYSISPDGTSIASLSYVENKLSLISAESTKSFWLPEATYGEIWFLENGSIFAGVSRDNLIGVYKQGAGFTDRYYVLDPTTGRASAGSIFLPGFTTGTQSTFPIDYSADLHYVVYEAPPYSDGSPRYNLLDLETNAVVWSGPTSAAHTIEASLPTWKPHSSALTYIWSTDEKNSNGYYYYYGNFFTISLDGSIAQLTQFERSSVSNLGRGWLLPASWSPNGRYLAFRLSQPGYSSLYVWDDQQKLAYRPCLPDENQAYSDYSVYWSFDSDHLLLRLVYPNPQSLETPTNILPTILHTTDVIIDMTTKTIFQLPDENNRGEYSAYVGQATPLGWVNWEIP